MPKKARSLPEAACVLAECLRDAATATKLGEVFHRTMLWKWSTGRGCPDLASAFLLEDLTGGRLPARLWAAVRSDRVATVAA